MGQQIILAVALGLALFMFIWGRWRYDIVALVTLLALVLLNIVPAESAFTGFAHPAVITVAAVLVVSQGLRNSGAIDMLASGLRSVGDSLTLQLLALMALTAVCSGFMNNIGALAILMPVAIRMARSSGRPPSLLLLPIAIASLLGGMCTLIGTPPNIIISAFRDEELGKAYRMFDFLPVGLPVTIVCVTACALLLWRLLPRREPGASRDTLFDIAHYVAELKVGHESKAHGALVRDLTDESGGEVILIGIARNKRMIRMPTPYERLQADDVLILEADTDTMTSVADAFGLAVSGDEALRDEFLTSGDIALVECIVLPDAMLTGRTVVTVHLRQAYGINLLGIARRGQRVRGRLRETRLEAGDVLLLQGDPENIAHALPILGCLPLSDRGVRLGQPRRIVMALGLMIAAVALVVFGLLPVEIAFTACACMTVLAGLVPLRNAYNTVDWPIIVLLGAMIPVGEAVETTGAAERMSQLMLALGSTAPPWVAIGLLMSTCMALSNVVNNAAAAVLMAPIAVSLARGIGASVDPFLMATAIGCSAAFLTPIGHQSNTLVMGPGGYRFADYLRLGLPCSLLTLVLGTLAILWRWPLFA